ncbi:MAG: LysR family transcriptional regulator [Proteobacteria bacterium]|nr:LysR family transcriptional regulator [Pseudomonadota bacterium]NOG60003.1 LysR family transcriptional regulator [Pseudomonadota bacterium]
MMPNSYQLKFEFRHLRSFIVIAEELSFRKAAEVLHIAQPALSRQIAQLEEALDCQLFDRQKRKIKLTEAGKYLYEKLPNVINQIYEVSQHTQKIATGQSAILKIGYSSAAMSSFLPAIIRELQNNLESCEFKFVEDTSNELIRAVTKEQLNAAFILFRPKLPLLKTIPIKADKMGIILPEDHDLTRKKRIALKDLKDETLILFPRHTNPEMYDEIISSCQNAGFSPKAIIETAPRSTAIGLVAAGQGIATIAESLKDTSVKGTTYRPLEQPCPMINYSCIVRSDKKGHWLKVLNNYIKENLT